MSSKSPTINLIKIRKSFFEKFLAWALTAGRIVVIVTEGIALSAFLFRFSLDRQIIDLGDQIKQKQAILSYMKSNEDTYRNLQDRLRQISTLSSKIPVSIAAFNDIANFVPAGVTMSNFIIDNNSIRIEASANSIAALSSFIQNLRAYDKVSSVSLDQIENRTSTSTIAFGISVQLKK